MSKQVILICGSRTWANHKIMKDVLYDEGNMISLVVHGGCNGADMMAEKICNQLSIPTKIYHAQWEEYGKSAGPIRNITMYRNEAPDMVYVFHDNLNESKGSKHMVKVALQDGCKVYKFSRNDPYGCLIKSVNN